MHDNLFSIGEISKIKGITIKALRFYEKMGLLKPHFIDPSTKYRYYSHEQFIYLDIIKASRSMDISPKDIKVILEKKDNKILLDFLNFQKESAVRKIAEMQKLISMIEITKSTIQNSITSLTNKNIFFKDIPLRYIITTSFDENSDEKDILVEYSKFDKVIEDNKLINSHETGIIFTLNEKSEFHPALIFNRIIIDTISNSSIITTIEKGRFLCICYNKNNAQDQLTKFNTYLLDNKLTPTLILQVDLLNNIFAYDNQYVELQALV